MAGWPATGCICSPGFFGADCTGVRSKWNPKTQLEEPTASHHGCRLDFGDGSEVHRHAPPLSASHRDHPNRPPAQVCDPGWETRPLPGSSVTPYCGFKSCTNDCWSATPPESACPPLPVACTRTQMRRRTRTQVELGARRLLGRWRRARPRRVLVRTMVRRRGLRVPQLHHGSRCVPN